MTSTTTGGEKLGFDAVHGHGQRAARRHPQSAERRRRKAAAAGRSCRSSTAASAARNRRSQPTLRRIRTTGGHGRRRAQDERQGHQRSADVAAADAGRRREDADVEDHGPAAARSRPVRAHGHRAQEVRNGAPVAAARTGGGQDERGDVFPQDVRHAEQVISSHNNYFSFFY